MNGPLRAVWQSRWGLPIGYAIHSEELALALLERGVDLTFRNTPWPRQRRIANERLRRVADRPPFIDAPQISYEQADLFYLDHPHTKIGYTMLEVDGLPADWVLACNRMDEIWVPTHWGRERFAESGVKRPIKVMPLGYDPRIFHSDGLPARPDGRFTFLSVFEWGERKAPDLLLRSFCRAFTRKDDVLLVLRVNNFDGHVDVAEQIEAMRLPEESPPIALLYNTHIRRPDLGKLYRSADCFVLPTRGEGWGMPILEAMACGVPVIATAWSGPTEFLTERVGYPLRSRGLVKAEAKCPYYEGLRWADPDPDQLVELLREVRSHPEEARRRGACATEEAASRWTWEAAARRIEERLREIGA